MSEHHRVAIEAVLGPGETLEWSGGPDIPIMKKTLGKRKRKLPLIEIGIVAIIVVVVMMNSGEMSLGGGMFGGCAGDTEFPVDEEGGWGLENLWLLVFPLFFGGILYLRKRKEKQHVENLSYGITDRRVLIVRAGEIIESWSPAELQEFAMHDRVGADGYYDIIWHRRAVRHDSENTPSPLQLERARVGFKALPDGPAVLARLEAWRKQHNRAAE